MGGRVTLFPHRSRDDVCLSPGQKHDCYVTSSIITYRPLEPIKLYIERPKDMQVLQSVCGIDLGQ